jgi:ABC-type branched-subunit amino acid transport system ATPase component
LRKRYRGVEALRGVSIRVAPGEVYGLLGPNGAGTAAFYRAMSLFRQGKADEARTLAAAAAAKMKPLPTDEKNPLAGNARADDLILWMAYKEAKALIQFEAAPKKVECN